MKNTVILLIVFTLCVFSLTANASQSLDVVSSQVEPKESVKKKYVYREDAFGRGVVNILTCWLEIPRNMINDNFIVFPGLGVLTGAIKGPFYTLGRVGSGLIDFVTFGSLGNSFYNEERFPEYVWHANWLGNQKNNE